MPKNTNIYTAAIEERNDGISQEWVDVNEEEARRHKLYGIRGWAIVLAIGLVFSIIIYSSVAKQSFDAIGAMGDAGYFNALAFTESFVNVILACSFLVAFFLLVTKKPGFQKIYPPLLWALPVIGFLDSVAVSLVMEAHGVTMQVWDFDTIKFIVGGIVAALVWGTYAKVSKRINVTTRHRVQRDELHLVRDLREAAESQAAAD